MPIDPILGTAEGLMLWLAIAVMASLLAAAAYPWYRRVNGRGSTAARGRALLCYGLLGPLAASLVLFLIMHPQWSVVLIPDHCHGDDCLPHRPEITVATPVGASLVSVSLILAAALLGVIQSTVRRTRSRLLALRLLSRPQPHLGYHLVESPNPMAWCAGVFRPRVYLTRGLLETLPPKQLRAVLAHEHAHAVRLDNLRRLVLCWATLAWPRPLRRRLLSDFADCTERACDRAAVAHVGDPQVVASALQRLGELSEPDQRRPQLAFDGVDVASRVRALNGSNENPPAVAAWVFLGVMWVVLVAALTGPSHRVVEWATGLGG
jgi:Zn-dependent protease with chaperone function